MSPTLVPQITSADLSEFVSDVGWLDVQRDPQNSTWNPNRDLLTALSDIAAHDAAARLRPVVRSRRDLTFMPERLYEPLPLPVRWPAGAAKPLSPRTLSRLLSDQGSRTKRRAVADARGFSKLRLTPRQYQQVTRGRLRSTDSDVRARAYERFQLLRQWEGEVIDVEAHHFRGAVVTVESTGRLRREHMRFPISLVRKQDRDALAEGAAFYYCVGRFISKGQTTPGSVLWFRRFLENTESVDALVRRAEALSRIEWTS